MEFEGSDPPASVDGPWPLVGRDVVLERALVALRGATRTIALYGPSGVGKSRVAFELAAALEEEGWLSVTIAGNPALSAVPLATLAPVLARDTSAPIASATDAVALFAAASTVLTDIGGGRRILLVLEDAAAADPVSVALIAQLTDAGHLRVLATVAEGEPLPDGMLGIAAAPDAVRIDLSALDVDQTAELLGLVLGAPIAHRAAVELHRASSGNPLFLRELVIGAQDAGTLVRAVDHWHLTGDPVGSPALRDLIRARLRSLTPEERDAVERLALCQPLALDEFARPGAPEALADLEQRGLIRVHEAGGRIRVLLTHPQYAAAVRETIPRIRQVALLGEQADLIATRAPSPADELRIALWRLDAGRRSDPGLLLRTAHLARQAHDHRGAERLVAAAIASGADDAGSHLLHAQLLWALMRSEDALSALDRAQALAETTADAGDALTAITTQRAEIVGSDEVGSARGIRLIDELEGRYPEQRAKLLLGKASLLVNLEHPRDALALVDAAAPAFGDTPLERAVLALARSAPLNEMQRTDESTAGVEDAVAYARQEGSFIPRRRALIALANGCIAADRLADARTATVESLHTAIGDDDQWAARVDEFMMGRIFERMGRLDTAARWFRDTVSGAELHGPISLRAPSLAFLSIISAHQGDLESARAARVAIGPGDDEEKRTVPAVADAWIARLEGDVPRAAALLVALAEELVPRGGYTGAAAILQHLARLGPAAQAADAADRLDALPVQTPAIRRRVAHARAEADGDAAALRTAGAEWERIGALLYAAEAYASAGRAARAAGHGRESSADLQRSASLAAACEGARTPLLSFADASEPLTPREREVASLAAQGLSSNEIAQRLFLSPRTVNNHLQSTYTKLGIRGRHELAV
ncbi:helix-turn-helix transcriptional regulator [Microbacterium sp. ASV49]|uniref:LuxR C-terminal-related transcriptional regulator n=1 Tax=Microbacterium candidum TaxID=3041922 RepID=A0ABT7MXJ0_9MICO|nr:LuxR family transcriptional regulator [Microbacterium sp. ASV49]MDL9979165.1 LuxR C-terminal-related transcriptional regulator [Microbacterium sp. ASV49]